MSVERWYIENIRHLSPVLRDHLMSLLILHSSKFSLPFLKMWKIMEHGPLEYAVSRNGRDAFLGPVICSALHTCSHHWGPGYLESRTPHEGACLAESPEEAENTHGHKSPCLRTGATRCIVTTKLGTARLRRRIHSRTQEVTSHVPQLCKLLTCSDFKKRRVPFRIQKRNGAQTEA